MLKIKNIKILNKIYKTPITCLTAYSAPIAQLLDGKVDIVLVGDSLGTTLYGMKNTQDVSIDMMKVHGLAVKKNLRKSLMIIDMPAKSYDNKSDALKNISMLSKYTRSNLIKLEINEKKIEIISYLSKKKFNIVAHIGVTPQKFKNFKKIKAVGKTINSRKKLVNLARLAEQAGAKILLLECVAQETAKIITNMVSIPTIGIGSSKYCDGQVLVTDDLINLNKNYLLPKFVKKYSNVSLDIEKSINRFVKDVKSRKFPLKKNTYS